MRIVLDWFPNPDHVPLYAGGLGEMLVEPEDPDAPLTMLGNGQVDLALNYQPNVTLARARGLPVRAVGLLIDQVLDTLMVRADGTIRSIRDLAGRRVAYAVEPFDRVMFQAMARHVGLEAGSWTFVDVGFQFTKALLEDRVDAVMGAFRNYEVIEAEEHGMPVRVFELTDHGVPPFYQLVFVARDDLAPERAREVREALSRVTEGIAATRRRPDDAFRLYVRANPGHDDRFHRRAFDATIPVFAQSHAQDPRRWQDFAAFLHSSRLLERIPAAGDLFTNELSA